VQKKQQQLIDFVFLCYYICTHFLLEQSASSPMYLVIPSTLVVGELRASQSPDLLEASYIAVSCQTKLYKNIL